MAYSIRDFKKITADEISVNTLLECVPIPELVDGRGIYSRKVTEDQLEKFITHKASEPTRYERVTEYVDREIIEAETRERNRAEAAESEETQRAEAAESAEAQRATDAENTLQENIAAEAVLARSK